MCKIFSLFWLHSWRFQHELCRAWQGEKWVPKKKVRRSRPGFDTVLAASSAESWSRQTVVSLGKSRSFRLLSQLVPGRLQSRLIVSLKFDLITIASMIRPSKFDIHETESSFSDREVRCNAHGLRECRL